MVRGLGVGDLGGLGEGGGGGGEIGCEGSGATLGGSTPPLKTVIS